MTLKLKILQGSMLDLHAQSICIELMLVSGLRAYKWVQFQPQVRVKLINKLSKATLYSCLSINLKKWTNPFWLYLRILMLFWQILIKISRCKTISINFLSCLKRIKKNLRVRECTQMYLTQYFSLYQTETIKSVWILQKLSH